MTELNNDLNWNWNGGALTENHISFKDAAENWPSTLKKHEGKLFYHAGTKHLYQIIGVTYQSEDDRWMLAYKRVTKGGVCVGPVFNHRPEDFFREGRFMEVDK